MSDTANLLAALAAEAAKCLNCDLGCYRTKSVFSSGSHTASLMLIGEAPGEDEDKAGTPFVGASGQLLDKMLSTCLGLTRDEVYVANVVKCRPPSNRKPHPEEVAQCIGYLTQQITLVAPRVIVTLGATATQAILKTEEKIGQLRGKTFSYNNIPVVPTWHPSYLLRRAVAKWDTVDDMKVVKELLMSGRVA